MKLKTIAAFLALPALLFIQPLTAGPNDSILSQITLNNATMVSTPPTAGAGAGDQNPYGVAFVPPGFPGGAAHPGDILVSNFNNAANFQGTGTTIVRITPHGEQSVFFQGPAGLGLTTALGVLRSGFVVVGNLPTDSSGAALQGSLIILDSNGKVVTTL